MLSGCLFLQLWYHFGTFDMHFQCMFNVFWCFLGALTMQKQWKTIVFLCVFAIVPRRSVNLFPLCIRGPFFPSSWLILEVLGPSRGSFEVSLGSLWRLWGPLVALRGFQRPLRKGESSSLERSWALPGLPGLILGVLGFVLGVFLVDFGGRF